MRYAIKRTGQSLIILYVVVTISFVMYRLMPGGPVEHMRNMMLMQLAQEGDAVNMERVNRLVEAYTGINPDRPLYMQYIEYMKEILLQQDFGHSIWHNEPVFDILFAAMPWSIFVSVYGLLLGFTTNVILGAFMAYRENSRFDNASTLFILVMGSIPYYVGAVFFLMIFAYNLGWFPTGGRFNTATTPGLNLPFMLGVLHHGALPVLTGFIVGFGGGALGMRGNSIRVMGEDYVRNARLRGIGQTRIATRYIARNAILPLYTTFMLGIAGIFSSGVIMEQIFTYPGVGWYTFGALMQRDYPLLMGAFIFYTSITIMGILIADLTYGFVDPRIKTGEENESF